MPQAVLIHRPELAAYRFPPGHPFVPERFTRAVDLIEDWRLIEAAEHQAAYDGTPNGAAPRQAPEPAAYADLLRAHSAAYLAHVRSASARPELAEAGFGIGPGDTPAFEGMHEAAALVAGASILALQTALGDSPCRAFAPAGGLHHAMRDRAAGFCIYNDCAIAIEHAINERPGLRVAYVDIDAHHGDGVQAAFYKRADVLTVSIHESGRHLFPGTGFEHETGSGAGTGFAVNVPLPPGSGDAEFRMATQAVIAPAVRAFRPDVMFAQLGADAHRDDPLTHLDLTVAGYASVVRGLVHLADDVCDGRLAATGGGGYEPFWTAPRMWACAFAHLADIPVPAELPATWLTRSAEAAGVAEAPVRATFEEAHASALDAEGHARVRAEAEAVIERVIAASPLLNS